MNTLHCTITSPSEQIYSGEVASVTATGALGELGLMPGHSPLFTQLAPGPVQLVSPEGAEQIFYLAGGFLEVQPGSVNILADVARRSEEMDEDALEQARSQALAQVQVRGDDFDYAEAAAHLAQLSAQLRTLKLIREQSKK